MAFVIRAAAGQPNFRPRAGRKVDNRPRAASSSVGPVSSGTSPAPASPPQGGFPLFCLPLLVLSAAMPIYGYRTQMKLIEDARAKHRASLATAASSTPAVTAPAATPKTGK